MPANSYSHKTKICGKLEAINKRVDKSEAILRQNSVEN
jgi:hypothetical protein